MNQGTAEKLDARAAVLWAGSQEPQVTEAPMAQDALAWLEALSRAGVVMFNAKGAAVLPPKVRELTAALHEVLAGGTVKVDVVVQGDPKLRSELDGKLERAMAAVNALSSDETPLFP